MIVPQISNRYDMDPMNPKSSIEFEVTDRGKSINRKIPIYDGIVSGDCSFYARLAAQCMFGKEYSRRHAWNRRYDSNVEVIPVQGRTLRQLVDEGLLNSGDLVGINRVFSLSRFNWGEDGKSSIPTGFRRDEKGKLVRYTHNGVYIGDDPETFEPLIAHFMKEVKIDDDFHLRLRAMWPSEILKLKN